MPMMTTTSPATPCPCRAEMTTMTPGQCVMLRYDYYRRYACTRPAVFHVFTVDLFPVTSVPQVSSLIETIIRLMLEGPQQREVQIRTAQGAFKLFLA
jgi:hypothetical protein